jgi:hypothetical protein
MQREIGIVAMVVGIVWTGFWVAALIVGFSVTGNIENSLVGTVDLMRSLDLLNVFERPLVDLRGGIQGVSTVVKVVLVGMATLMTLPQLLLIYTGYQVKRGASRRR